MATLTPRHECEDLQVGKRRDKDQAMGERGAAELKHIKEMAAALACQHCEQRGRQ